MTYSPGISLEEEIRWIQRGAEEVFPEYELRQKLTRAREEGRPLRVKLGIDPTASDLHVGHVIPILKLRQLQKLGHQAVLIVGDYTAMLGDPSGRNQERPQLTHEETRAHARHYEEQVFKILDPDKTEVVMNGSWFGAMSFSEVIGLLSQMTLARMLEREDFGNRYRSQSPISLHELVYPLMQGYDSVMVRADIELGGIDQKFNILVGRDLQKASGQEPQVGVCNPVLIGLDGKEKMSKSLGNYIGLNDPPHDMFGKVMSIPDELMWSYFELLTPLSLTEIGQMQANVKAGSLHPRDAKARLAEAVVGQFCSPTEAQAAKAHFERVIARGELPDAMPEAEIREDQLRDGRIWIVKLLVETELAASNGEARRLIEQGGVRLNGEVVTDANFEWSVEDGAALQVGKRKFCRVRRA